LNGEKLLRISEPTAKDSILKAKLLIIATKPTKKREILFLFSCDFVVFVANNSP
jgi:hypothetical protein